VIVKPGTADVTTYFVLRLAATGVEATGLTITNFDLQYTRSGVAPVAKVDATALAATDSAHGDNQAIEIDATDQPGLYRVDWPDAAFATGVREVICTVKCATAFTEHLRVELGPSVDVGSISGDATSADNLESYTDGTTPAPVNVTQLSGDTTAADNSEAFFDGTGYAGTNNVIPTVSVLTGHTAQTGDCFARLGAPAGASVSADIAAIEAQTDDIGAAGAGLTAVPWNAAWDAEVQSEVDDALVARNLDKLVILSGTADSGSTTTLVDAALTQADADWWKGRLILFTSGTLLGQCAIVTDFNAGTDTLTFAPAVTAAVSTHTYVILPGVSVWDDTLAEHLAAGTTGNALNAAGAAGDPWSTALPGAYGAGTAGKIIGDNINATVSSRATQTSVDTIDDFLDTEVAAILAAVDTEVGAIKAVTDAIGATGSGLSAIPWNAAWDAEVQSEVDDALVAQRLDELLNADSDIDGAAPPTVGSVFHELLTKTAGSFTYDQTTDSLEAVRDNMGTAQTGDCFARLGAPAGASVSADILVLDNLVDDLESRLGTPSDLGTGATVAANLVDIEGLADNLPGLETKVDTIDDFLDTEVAAIKAKTDQLVFTVANQVDANALSVGAGAITAAAIATGAVDADALATDAIQEIADGVLKRKLDSTGDGTDTLDERTVRSALRGARNKRSIAGATLTVTKEDDATTAWTAAIGTAAVDPVTSIDPA
jgi:hypothetical protein